MGNDASAFWERYKLFAHKEFPVTLNTGIAQSTISTWRRGKKFPPADKAQQIAEALNTTVEYLVTGTDSKNPDYSPSILSIANIATHLTDKGVTTLYTIAAGLEMKYKK